MADNEDIERLRLENLTLQSKLNELTKERLNKNYVTGGYLMVPRSSEKHMRLLQTESPTGALVLSVLREYMKMGSNSVVISSAALAIEVGKSVRQVTRGIKYLREKKYVQVLKSGSTNVFVVNKRIAFSGRKEQQKAVFNAVVAVSATEQKAEELEDQSELKKIPVPEDGERMVLDNEVLMPPDQNDLELN